MRRLLFAILTAVFALAVATPGDAHLRAHDDPNDATLQDLSRVKLRTYRNGDGVKMLLATAFFFPDHGDGDWSLSFNIDSRRGDEVDFILSVASDDASGGIYYVGLSRPDGSAVDARILVTRDCAGCYSHLPVKFKYGVLHATRHIRWFASTASDRAPDWGWYDH